MAYTTKTAATSATRVLSGYRRLLRAQKNLFAADKYAQSKAVIEIRHHFDTNRLVTDGSQIEEMIGGIDEAEDMLLHGILQGQLNPQKRSFEVKVKPDNTTKDQPIVQSMSSHDGMDHDEKVIVTAYNGKKSN